MQVERAILKAKNRSACVQIHCTFSSSLVYKGERRGIGFIHLVFRVEAMCE
jgi:hypothetical protein